jgi:hypothetical protein
MSVRKFPGQPGLFELVEAILVSVRGQLRSAQRRIELEQQIILPNTLTFSDVNGLGHTRYAFLWQIFNFDTLHRQAFFRTNVCLLQL